MSFSSNIGETNKVEVDGVTLFVTVSPCSYTYPSNGLQLKFALKEGACNAESVFKVRKDLPVSVASAAIMAAEAISAGVLAEVQAESAAWSVKEAEYAAEFKAREVKRAAVELELDQKMLARGFTHKFVGWVHPTSGDDRQVCAYVQGQPSDAQIKKLLRGSVDKTDFVVTPIKKVA